MDIKDIHSPKIRILRNQSSHNLRYRYSIQISWIIELFELKTQSTHGIYLQPPTQGMQV